VGRDELPRACEPGTRLAIERSLRTLGFREVLVDPAGYRLGSLNEGLRLEPV